MEGSHEWGVVQCTASTAKSSGLSAPVRTPNDQPRRWPARPICTRNLSDDALRRGWRAPRSWHHGILQNRCRSSADLNVVRPPVNETLVVQPHLGFQRSSHSLAEFRQMPSGSSPDRSAFEMDAGNVHRVRRDPVSDLSRIAWREFGFHQPWNCFYRRPQETNSHVQVRSHSSEAGERRAARLSHCVGSQ